MARFDCLCVGQVVVDHLCAPIARMPAPGELVLSDRLVLDIGGCAANAAVALARLGRKVAIVGCIGDDLFGTFACEVFSRAGVDTSLLAKLAGVDTSGTLVVNVQGEDRRFITARGATTKLTVDRIPRDAAAASKVLYIGGYLMADGLDPHALADLFAFARSCGTATVLDVVAPGPGPHAERLKPVLPFTDVFLPNQDEAALISGLEKPTEQAAYFRAMGAACVVVTSGSAGSLLASESQWLQAGIFPVAAVDGSGAGDAFDAGFISALLDGLPPADRLRWGAAMGASAVQAVGATAGLFDRPQAEAFLRGQELSVREVPSPHRR